MNALDAYVRHQIHLDQYTRGEVAKMVSLLETMEANIVAKLSRRKNTAFAKQRFNTMLASIRGELASGYKRIGKRMESSMRTLAKTEAKFNKDTIQVLSPADTVVAAVDPERLLVASQRTVFQGKTMARWMKSLEADQAKLITNELRQGWLLGETNDQIAARLAGDPKTVGVFSKGRNYVETIVRSGTNQLSAQARDRVFKNNARLIESVEWVSTLDGRTTISICAPRDGLMYTTNQEPIDHGYAWDGGPGSIHFNCRSVSVPKIKGQEDIDRTGLDFNQQTDSRAKSTVRYDPETRTSVGKGVRMPDAQRRGAGKMYSGTTDYQDWLKTQPAWFQNDALGSTTRGKLFRSGGLSLEKYSTKAGRTLTHQQLAQQYPSAWKKAGLEL